MSLSSFARRVSATVLPKVEASACIPPSTWTECDCTTTSAGKKGELYTCSTNCAGITTCSTPGTTCTP